MKLFIYKGFSKEFLEKLEERPLVTGDIFNKINVLSFDNKTRKTLEKELLNLEDSDTVWITYQEYSLIKTRIDEAIEEDGLEVIIYKNNLFPDYYPIEFAITDELATEIERNFNEIVHTQSDECTNFLKVYSTLINIDGLYYGSFFNYEYEKIKVKVKNFYPVGKLLEDIGETDFQIYLNEDIGTYLRDLSYISVDKPKTIGIRTTGGECSKRMLNSLLAYCQQHNIKVSKYCEPLTEEVEQEAELIKIAQEDIGIDGFEEFRKIPFYKNPDKDKEVIEISQGKIIREIIKSAENSYSNERGKSFKDIFITASTGAGKSVMFQIPAVYLAKKYNKLTIIIEPVIALMQDQKEKLNKSGYTRVEAFNSDLITQIEREAVLKRIKEGEVDLLYLSPETLLSYSIDTIIGDREIGLLIIDEAHLVTAWGFGFRPDYWYLGSYINRLRHHIQTNFGTKRKIYNFPICAFTATAINGGDDDSVSETIKSLDMQNPIKYIGYAKRDDIKFEINIKSEKKLPKNEYDSEKTKDLNVCLQEWIDNKEKSIVYFPYATMTEEAKRGVRDFSNIKTDNSIVTYTGKNINGQSREAFKEEKRENFEKFRNGTASIMYATKAFGMGVDINDIQNVYHYAPTGSLCDYVQEIGRAARKKSMTGCAVVDFYRNDLNFMKTLFGMSAIKQWQIRKVLEGIYATYKNKKTMNFLISPESFTYIFTKDKNDNGAINKLKTCLLMLENAFYEEYNHKVLIARPQSIFTKAYAVLKQEHLQDVLDSKFGSYFKYIQKGRHKELQNNGDILDDMGDIYSVDLKGIWETFYPKLSFPQFKYYYFNKEKAAYDNVEIMSNIRNYFSTRQRITIEVNNEDDLLCDIYDRILDDFEYIANVLYDNFGRTFFKIEDFMKLIVERYGKTKAKIIANSLFDLVDPDGKCVKHRTNPTTGYIEYSLANGPFKEKMRNSIRGIKIINNLSKVQGGSYSSYMNLAVEERSERSLKLLSVFGYITYEVSGGEEPEIFIRLNDSKKIEDIVTEKVHYSNEYVTKAGQKHKRDVEILSKFFTKLKSDAERWEYIEDYFLGYDVLNEDEEEVVKVEMRRAVDKEHSYTTNAINRWAEIYKYFEEVDIPFLKKLEEIGVPKPEYLDTFIKKSPLGEFILMSWINKDVLICKHETSDSVMNNYATMGWHAYRISEINYDQIKNDLE